MFKCPNCGSDDVTVYPETEAEFGYCECQWCEETWFSDPLTAENQDDLLRAEGYGDDIDLRHFPTIEEGRAGRADV